MIRVRLACLLTLTLAAWCTPTLAWGPRGHHIVARLAEAQLTPRALAESRRLLATRHAQHLAEVATWADDLRDIDPARFARSKRLHYVNFHSRDCDYQPPRDCRDGDCAVAGIGKYSAILADHSRSDAVRAEALAWLIHLVADIHQPLHAGYRRDGGGNRFQLRWQGKGSNLHRVWDSGLLATAHLSAARYAQRLATVRTPVAVGGTPAQWAEESCRSTRDAGVYPATHSLDAAYVSRSRPIAEQRLRQAGARLASLLNRDLGD